MDISVVGLGKLGAVLAAVLAEAGHSVIGIDPIADVVKKINDGVAPVDETGLQDLFDKIPRERLVATTEYSEAIPQTYISFIVVPTPSGLDHKFDASLVHSAVNSIIKNLSEAQFHIIVVCSTVMPGTMDLIIDEVRALYNLEVNKHYGLVYSPEFIALGSVIHDMKNPDMVIAGVEDDDVFDAFLDVSMSYVNADETPYHYLSYVDAEVAKIAVNTYLTMKINFANTVGEVCEGLPNGDAHQVLEAVGSDSRIGDKYLKVGGTPSGVCLPRDSKAFAALADSVGAKAPLAIATDEISTRTVSRISDMLGDYDNVAILGMTYKPDTAIITESLGLRLMHDLATEFCSVAVYDPIADLSSLVSDVTVAPSAEAAIKLSEAVVICTPLEEFSDLDFGGRFVIDVWNIAKSQPNVRRLGVAGRWEWVT